MNTTENTLPSQLRLAANIIEKGLPYEHSIGCGEWKAAQYLGNKMPAYFALNNVEIRLVPMSTPPTVTSESADIAPPGGFRDATTEELDCVPVGSLYLCKKTNEWRSSNNIGTFATLGSRYAVPIAPTDKDSLTVEEKPKLDAKTLDYLISHIGDVMVDTAVCGATGSGLYQDSASARAWADCAVNWLDSLHPGDIQPYDQDKTTEQPWIEHKGGECPLNDFEVEEWEYKMRNGVIHKSSKCPSGAVWEYAERDHERDIIAYRVTKAKPPAHETLGKELWEAAEEMVSEPFDLAAHVIANGFRPLAPGEQFHRLDWTAEMLPMGTRPHLLNEVDGEGDEYHAGCNCWHKVKLAETANWPTSDEIQQRRTRRKLPDLAPSAQADEGKSLGQLMYEAGAESYNAMFADKADDWQELNQYEQGRCEVSAQAVAAAVRKEMQAEVERLKLMTRNAELAAQEQFARAKIWENRYNEQAATCTLTTKERDEALARVKELEQMNENQMHTIQLVGQALGLPHDNILTSPIHVGISGLKDRIAALERQLAEAQTEINMMRKLLHDACRTCGVQDDALEVDSLGLPLAGPMIQQLTTLRPISEAGELAEGFVRVYWCRSEGLMANNLSFTTHFADLRLPIDANKKAETFEAHGHTWTKHVPGDPMPCAPDRDIILLLQDNTESAADSGNSWAWDKSGYNELGWRYAEPAVPEPVVEMVALEAKDILPGSVFHAPHWIDDTPAYLTIVSVAINDLTMSSGKSYSYDMLKDQGYKINRSIPLTGKWDSSAWLPCSKPSTQH